MIFIHNQTGHVGCMEGSVVSQLPIEPKMTVLSHCCLMISQWAECIKGNGPSGNKVVRDDQREGNDEAY
jgi:hypothetical protein